MIQQQQTRQSTTSYVVSGGYTGQSIVTNPNHIPGDLNCPCCNLRIIGEVNYNQNNYVEKQEIKKTVKERIVPGVVSNKKFVPNQNTRYCSIPGCTVCEGMYRLKEETETKVVILREVSHACEFQCQFCSYNAADARLLQLLEEHHIKMAEIKKQKEEELLKQQISEQQGQVEVQSVSHSNSRLSM